MHLLDVNVLIALGDSNHTHHLRARTWFRSDQCEAWATCPITENGFVRILGQPAYPEFDGGPNGARQLLEAMISLPGHQFWPDSLSVCKLDSFPDLVASKLLTDLYLLGLAVSKGGHLATLDRRLDPTLVPGGSESYFLIPE